jgi:hypothetical protein
MHLNIKPFCCVTVLNYTCKFYNLVYRCQHFKTFIVVITVLVKYSTIADSRIHLIMHDLVAAVYCVTTLKYTCKCLKDIPKVSMLLLLMLVITAVTNEAAVAGSRACIG